MILTFKYLKTSEICNLSSANRTYRNSLREYLFTCDNFNGMLRLMKIWLAMFYPNQNTLIPRTMNGKTAYMQLLKCMQENKYPMVPLIIFAIDNIGPEARSILKNAQNISLKHVINFPVEWFLKAQKFFGTLPTYNYRMFPDIKEHAVLQLYADEVNKNNNFKLIRFVYCERFGRSSDPDFEAWMSINHMSGKRLLIAYPHSERRFLLNCIFSHKPVCKDMVLRHYRYEYIVKAMIQNNNTKIYQHHLEMLIYSGLMPVCDAHCTYLSDRVTDDTLYMLLTSPGEVNRISKYYYSLIVNRIYDAISENVGTKKKELEKKYMKLIAC